MTADINLLPLPEEEWNVRYGYYADAMREYARVNVAHATAPLQAEIEALRVEVAAQRARANAMAGEAIKHEARAERLAESLRMMVEMVEMDGFGKGAAMDTARAALDAGRDQARVTALPQAPEVR